MENSVCPISGKRDFEPFLAVPDRFRPDSRWQIVRSRPSGLLMLDPRPSFPEIGRFYGQESYDPHLHDAMAGSLRNRLYLAARTLLLNRKASLVLYGEKKTLTGCRILEIGCSTGDLLRHLKLARGIPAGHLRGIETDPEAAAVAEAKTNVPIDRHPAGRSQSRKAFDRIVLWHAFEHVHDLHSLLNNISEQLDRQGTVVMALPNPESRDARHYRQHWVAWDAPRHHWHFTPSVLEALLAKHGFELCRMVPYLPDTLYTCWYSGKLAAREYGRSFGLAGIAEALVQAAAGIASAPFSREKASTLVYYFRKAR